MTVARIQDVIAGFQAVGGDIGELQANSRKITTDATRAPLDTDNASQGYAPGSRWLWMGLEWLLTEAGWRLAGEVSLQAFGFRGNGTKADTDKANAILDLVGSLGGGVVTLDSPGTYLLANTNPFPAATYPGTTESDANWWANRRALWIKQDNVKLRLGPGVVLKIADGANCHAIQIGQYSLGIGVPQMAVRGSGVIGSGWQIDMNGANQTPATAAKDHPAGIIVQHGSSRIEVAGGEIFGSTYYGLAFEGTPGDALQGFTDCHVHDMLIRDCRADGFDAKDFGTLSARNWAERVTIINCGSGGGDFLTGQAGIDLRGGWTATDCTVEFSDGYTGERVGFRGQYAPDYAASKYPTIFARSRAFSSGKHTGTVGFRLSGKGCEVDHCSAEGFDEALRMSAPAARVEKFTGADFNIGSRWFADAGAGWDADFAALSDCDFVGGTTAWRIDTGVSNARIEGGRLSAVTTPLVNNGTAKISNVLGFATKARVLATIPVSATGLQTVSAPHGLPFTPVLADVQISEQRGSNVSDYALGFMRVLSVDATNVTIEARVTTASATSGATTLARIEVDGMR